jgi:hypothetical protein
MPDFRSMYDSNYLYAFDLKGRDVTVTIKEVRAVLVKNADKKQGEKKPIVFFKESKDHRGLVLCKTNGKTIASLYGNDTEGWIGKRITLFPTEVDAFGKTVEAIRVRNKPPQQTAKAGEFAEVAEAPAPEAPDHFEDGAAV